jgi:5'-3' exonuclease
MVNKYALVIDFNNIAYRSLYTCKYGNSDISDFSSKFEQGIFARKLMTDICVLVSSVHPSEVYLAVDDKHPWRGRIFPTYKGNRKKDETVNWDCVYEVFRDVLDIISNHGYSVIQLPNTEADDIASMLKTKMIERGDTSVVFVSSDADWLQLIDFNPETQQFFASYNPITNNKGQRKFYTTKRMHEWMLRRASMFETESPIKSLLLNWIDKDYKIVVEEISPDNILLKKIMCGDDGDNVPAFYDFMNKTGKKVRVTEKKMERIFESCGMPSNTQELKDRVDDGSLKRSICSVFKVDTDNESLDYNIRLERQRLYVELNPTIFPNAVVAAFDKRYNEIQENRNTFYISTDSIGMSKGTKFEKANVTDVKGTKLNNIFKNLVDRPVITFKV